VRNLENMADGVTYPVLNPEYVSHYDRLYEVRRCHAADMPEEKKHGIFFELLA
jgi:hypothetical protein